MLWISLALAGGAVAPPPTSALSDGGCDATETINQAFAAPLDITTHILLLQSQLCERATPFGSEQTFLSWQRASELLAHTHLPPLERVELALALAHAGQAFHRGPYIRHIAGVSIEAEAAEVIEPLLDQLTHAERADLHATLRRLSDSPTPDLEGERARIRAIAGQTDTCVAETEDFTSLVEPMLSLRGAKRLAALESLPSHEWSFLPWRQAQYVCLRGAKSSLLEWHEKREETDATWRRLAALTAEPDGIASDSWGTK